MTAIETMVGALTDAASDPREAGGAWIALCPAHEDHHPSLSLRGIEGQVLVYCHAGCTNDDVLAALNLTMRDLYDEPIGATYTYEDGRRVHRTPDKRFRQSGATTGTAQLYMLSKVVEAVALGQIVYLCEGEKDVLALESVGVVATTAPGGATNFGRVDATPLAGATVVAVVDKDEAGQKWVVQVRKALDSKAGALVFVHAVVGKDAADHIAAGYGVAEFVPVDELATVPALSVIRLSDVVPERVSWLWEGRIPRGKLVTLDGDPSLGKSTLALAFAAIVTTGGTWPDGSVCEFPGDVVLMAAEDGLADTVRPRLDAAGADCARVHAVQGVRMPGGSMRPPTLADVEQLHKLVVDTGARLLIIDVLMAYLPSGVDSHKDQDIRRVLSRLAAMADATGCTVLLLRHLNKAKGGDPLYRGGGSIGIVGAARAGMLVAKDPDNDQVRVLACTKSNLGIEPEGLTYRLTDDDRHGAARVEWLGTSTHNARTLLADPGDAPESPERDEARSWLEDYLTENRRPKSADVKGEAWKQSRISDRTLKRAAQDLKVLYSQEGFPRITYWSLPEGGNDSEDSEDKTDPTGPRPQNRGPTGPTGPTGADQRVYEASQDTDSQWGQSGHDSERRPDSGDSTPQSARLCPECGEPLPAGHERHPSCFNDLRVVPS